MLSVYVRHYPPCTQTSIHYRRCHCPKWIQGTLDGKAFIRTSAKTRSWEAAEKKVRKLENKDEAVQQITVLDAVTAFIDDERARNLAHASIYKSKSFFERQLLPWCKSRGIRYVTQFTPAELTLLRGSWKNAPATNQRKHERMHTLMKFCVDREWLVKNPMAALKKPKVDGVVPTNYFTREEFQKIIDATYVYDFGGGNDCAHRAERLRALVLLMRWSGLAITDAVTLERSRLNDNNSIFLYRAKTGVPVLVPLPPEVAAQLRALPNSNPRYFFWTGNGEKRSVTKCYQRSFWKLFTLASLKNPDGTPKRCHGHMLRDTFAVELLLAGVPIDQVSLLLGHSSVKITEKHYAPFVKARQQQLESYARMAWDKAESEAGNQSKVLRRKKSAGK